MKTLRQISAVMILSLTLAVSAMAGQIETWGAPEPAPPPPTTTQSTSTTAAIVLTMLGWIYG